MPRPLVKAASINFRLTPGQHDDLKTLARWLRIPVTQLIDDSIREYVSHLDIPALQAAHTARMGTLHPDDPALDILLAER